MGEAEMCEGCGCGKWEERMYWTHFQTMHFCVILVGDFVDEFAIPQKFAKHLKEKLRGNVTLKGPSGDTWNVGLVTSGANMFFKDGWKKFISDHSLQQNDILVFKYHRDSCFDLLIFDSMSSCEMETSYFVRKCGHTTHDVGLQTIIKTRDRDEGVESPSVKKPRKDDVVMQKPSPLGLRRNAPRAKKKIQKVAHSITRVTPRRKIKTKEPSASVVEEQNISEESDAEERETSNNRGGGYPLQYVSNRRPVTDLEKDKALQLAQVASTNESFISIMRPTNVYKKFYLFGGLVLNYLVCPTSFVQNIPLEWANSRISVQNQDVILLYKGNTWRTRFNLDGRGGGGISAGWREFALENNLEEFDVCRFELASPAGNTTCMNVSIFRVLDESTPLTRVSSASLKSKAI